MFFLPYLSAAKPAINAEMTVPAYRSIDPNPDSLTCSNDRGRPIKPNVPAATLNISHEIKYNQNPWVVRTAIHLLFLHTTLSQGSINSAKRLIALKMILMSRCPIDPNNWRFDIIPMMKIRVMNVINIKAPEMRPLSSTVVDSAKHARIEGNPSPKEVPTNIPENRENSNPLKTATDTVVISPKKIQKLRNRLRFHFPLIMLPIIAEITIEA